MTTSTANQSVKSVISKKRQDFTKKLRTQHIQSYMNHIRTSLMQSYQHNDYVQLRNLINELFAQNQQFLSSSQSQSERKIIQEKKYQCKQNENTTTTLILSKLRQLISYANSHNKYSTLAIVAIAQLLHSKLITIDMIIEHCGGNNHSNNNNNNNIQVTTNDLMSIINLPANGTTISYGWLVLIRVLMTLGYCTQDMIAYCIRVIILSKSPSEIELSLEVLFILVVQKRLVAIDQLYKLTLARSNHNSSTQTQTPNNIQQQQPLRTQQLIYALMSHSLDNCMAKEYSQIRYYSTKLLTLSFRQQHILSDIVLNLIPLPRIASHIKQKFLISTCYDKKKALQLLSQLLLTLTTNNHYHSLQIISILLPTITHVIEYTRILSQQIDTHVMLGERFNITFKKNYSSKQQSQRKIIEDNFLLLQQALFLIEIIIQDYVFSYVLPVPTVIQLLQDYMLEHILICLYSAYNKQLKQQNYFNREDYQTQLFFHGDGEVVGRQQQKNNNREGYSEYDLRRMVFVQKVAQLAGKMTFNLIKLSGDIRLGNIPISTQQQVGKFLLLRNLIISRFRKSELQIVAQRQLNLAGIDLNYI